MLEHTTPDENGYLPTPYELGGQGELTEMLRQAGFEKTRETRVPGVWTASTAEEYLTMILAGTPIGHSLSEEDPNVQEQILKKAAKTSIVMKQLRVYVFRLSAWSSLPPNPTRINLTKPPYSPMNDSLVTL